MSKLKPNQERIDFVTDRDIEKLCTELAAKFGKDSLTEIVGWALSNGYRTGIHRGIEMAKEADVYVENGTEDER